MVYTRDQLLSLAEALSRYTGMALSTLGTRIAGNDKMFVGLAQGGDCRLSNAERASLYFDNLWPVDLPWPIDVPRPVHGPQPHARAPRLRIPRARKNSQEAAIATV